MRVVEHLRRLPRQVVGALSLETFKVRLDVALSNLIEFKMSILIAGALNQMTFKYPFQSKLFYLSVNTSQVFLYFDYRNYFCYDAFNTTVKGYNSIIWRLYNETINTCVLLSLGNCFLPCVLDIKLFRAGLPPCAVVVNRRGYMNNTEYCFEYC